MNSVVENEVEPLPAVYSEAFKKIIYWMLEKDR